MAYSLVESSAQVWSEVKIQDRGIPKTLKMVVFVASLK